MMPQANQMLVHLQCILEVVSSHNPDTTSFDSSDTTILIETLDNPGWVMTFPKGLVKGVEKFVGLHTSIYLDARQWVEIHYGKHPNSESSFFGREEQLTVFCGPCMLHVTLEYLCLELRSTSDLNIGTITRLARNARPTPIELWYDAHCDGEWEHLFGPQLQIASSGAAKAMLSYTYEHNQVESLVQVLNQTRSSSSKWSIDRSFPNVSTLVTNGALKEVVEYLEEAMCIEQSLLQNKVEGSGEISGKG